MQGIAKDVNRLSRDSQHCTRYCQELKLLRQNAKHEFHQLYASAQETAQAQEFTLEMPRLTARMTNRCNIAAATDGHYF